MKKTIWTLTLASVFLTLPASLFAQGLETQRTGPGRSDTGRYGQRARGGQLALISALPKEELSQNEIDALMLMREEEKLARDVYLALYDLWELPAFLNIASSEQRHFDAVGTLIQKYELDDPAGSEAGAFMPGSSMQNLYENLLAAGETSQEDALRVGATIEDLDIYDLRRLLEEVDNRDIKIVFQNLLNGSMNHLRAFTRLLQPEIYEAQYLSQAEVEEIISTERGRGRYGNGRGSCGMYRAGEIEPGTGNCRRRGAAGN